MLVNDKEIMGDLVSPLWANVLSTGVVFATDRSRRALRDQHHCAQHLCGFGREVACCRPERREGSAVKEKLMVKKQHAQILISSSDQSLVLSSLEHDQLVKAKKHYIPRRHLKGPELLVLWAPSTLPFVHDGSGWVSGMDCRTVNFPYIVILRKRSRSLASGSQRRIYGFAEHRGS